MWPRAPSIYLRAHHRVRMSAGARGTRARFLPWDSPGKSRPASWGPACLIAQLWRENACSKTTGCPDALEIPVRRPKCAVARVALVVTLCPSEAPTYPPLSYLLFLAELFSSLKFSTPLLKQFMVQPLESDSQRSNSDVSFQASD